MENPEKKLTKTTKKSPEGRLHDRPKAAVSEMVPSVITNEEK